MVSCRVGVRLEPFEYVPLHLQSCRWLYLKSQAFCCPDLIFMTSNFSGHIPRKRKGAGTGRTESKDRGNFLFWKSNTWLRVQPIVFLRPTSVSIAHCKKYTRGFFISLVYEHPGLTWMKERRNPGKCKRRN